MQKQNYVTIIRASADYMGAASEMDEAVSEMRREGWHLHGPTQMTAVHGEVVFLQVMVWPREEGDNERKTQPGV